MENELAELTRNELAELCKSKKIKGYSNKCKKDLITLLEKTSNETSNEIKECTKKNFGQFYTTNSEYILEGFQKPPSDIKIIIEPFAGNKDISNWIQKEYTESKEHEEYKDISILLYDIDPKFDDIIRQDTLLNPPNYEDNWVITNPPFLARNKSQSKDLYDLYDTNDLYKCFIKSLIDKNCRGGILIIPVGFFLSNRENDFKLRDAFMKKYQITKIKYFEETVFEDTSTSVVAFSFIRFDSTRAEPSSKPLGPNRAEPSGKPLGSGVERKEQIVEWNIQPKNLTFHFKMSSENSWIVGGDIYNLPSSKSIKRYVQGYKLSDGEQQLFITLDALDSGREGGRLCCKYQKDYVYPAKDSSRSYATLILIGKTLSEQEQIELCEKFNTFIEKKREETYSLFLPQFRESKEYSRKRIPFDLAYRIISYLIN